MRNSQRWIVGFLASICCVGPLANGQTALDWGTAAHSLLLPSSMRFAEIHYERSRFILIDRRGSPMPGVDDHSVTLLDNHASPDFSPRLAEALPDSLGFNIRDASVGPTEVLLAVDRVTKENTHENIVVGFDLETRRPTRVIHTGPVPCMEIVVDAASALWCLGVDTSRPRAEWREWTLLHRLSADGRILKSAIRRADLTPATPLHPLADTTSGPTKLIASGRYLFAWIAPLSTYVQVDSKNARVVRIVTVPQGLRGITFKEDGTPVMGYVGLPRTKTRLLKFDLFSNTWIEDRLSSQMPDGSHVIGYDGTSYVLWDRKAHQVVWWADDPLPTPAGAVR